MKKNIIFAAFAAVSALLLVSSCAKEQLRENINTGDGKVFMAVINQDLTKTTITDEYKVNWDQGDLIDISGGATYSATPDASDATKATFTKVSGLDPTPDYIAVYPASIFKNGRHELPATQTYAAGKFNAPMCAISETESLEFKNFCGVLCFALKGTDKVKSIAVTANEQLCGPFEFSTDATFGCFSGENEGYTVTLDCGEGVQLSATDSTNFYISLPPATYTAGMKIVITNTEGKTIEKTTTKSAAIARNQIYTFNWTASFSPAGALKGVFSVSADKKVHFSQGNLVATIDANGAPKAWKFATNQYDHLGTGGANKTIGKNEGDIDLFGWSTASTTYGISTSNSSSSYSGDFVDWGKNIGDGNTWRTLTKDEWDYLFITRTASTVSGTATARYAKATVNSKAGVILLPDTYAHPEGVTALTNINTAEAAFTANEYDSTNWEKMESAGAVFLPAAGRRNGSNVSNVGDEGDYWSSTKNGSSGAYRIYFKSDNVYPYANGNRNVGHGVRLVTEVK